MECGLFLCLRAAQTFVDIFVQNFNSIAASQSVVLVRVFLSFCFDCWRFQVLATFKVWESFGIIDVTPTFHNLQWEVKIKSLDVQFSWHSTVGHHQVSQLSESLTAVLSFPGGAATTSTATPAQNSQDHHHHTESETECLLEEEEEEGEMEEEEEEDDGVVRGDKTSQDDSGICDGPGSLEVLSCVTGPSLTSLPEASCPSPAPHTSSPQTTS